MDAMLGPDGRPSTFNGAAWVSQDGRYWWNGTAWQPLRARRSFQPPYALAAIILIVIAGAWVVFTRVIPPYTPPPVVMGVTNARIDSSTQIEFDYARPSTCHQLSFQVVFYDKGGRSVGQYVTESMHDVSGGSTHHFVFETNDIIPSNAVRFSATPTCGG